MLLRSHHYVDQILAALGEGIIGLDDDCRVLFTNPWVEEMLRMPEQQMLGKRLCEATGLRLGVCAPSCSRFCRVSQIVDERRPVYRDELTVGAAEETRHVALTVRAIFESSGNGEQLIGAIAGFSDISDRKRAQAAERDAARMEAATTLAAGIAHDFNNLMVGVLGNAEMLKMDLAENSSACAMLEEITRVGRRAADLSQQMLAYARGGRRETVEMDIAALVYEVLRPLKASCPPAIQFAVNPESGLWSVKGDTHQIRQVLKNLLINAIEAVGERGRIEVTMGNATGSAANDQDVPPGTWVWISVRDNGCGIHAEVRDRIFEPLFSTKAVGRGIGLAAVQGIVRNHGGSINVDSIPDKGTRFHVLLPSSGRPLMRLDETQVTRRSPVGQTVLVVDDEEMVRRVAQVILERHGFAVLSAPDGRTAIDIARNHRGRIDAALLDVGMPGMGGDVVFGPLRAARPDLKIILCSGMSLEDGMQSLLEQGVTLFLPKPYDPQTLTEAVEKVLSV